MPFYEFRCKKCQETYDVMSTMKDKEKKTKSAKCPNCGSRRKDEILGAPNFNFTNPVGTSLFEKSHEYRYRWNNDRPGGVKDQRKMAEEYSHMGDNPYPDLVTGDVESGENFGEVK